MALLACDRQRGVCHITSVQSAELASSSFFMNVTCAELTLHETRLHPSFVLIAMTCQQTGDAEVQPAGTSNA